MNADYTRVESDDKFAEEGGPTRLIPNLPSNISNEHGLHRYRFTRNSHSTHMSWVRYVPYTFLAFTIMFVVGTGGWAFPDGANPTCDANKSSKNSAVCDIEKTLQASINSLLLLTGFILGGFLASSRALWLEKRRAYAALCGATRNL